MDEPAKASRQNLVGAAEDVQWFGAQGTNEVAPTHDLLCSESEVPLIQCVQGSGNIIALPSNRTLRNYTHVISAKEYT